MCTNLASFGIISTWMNRYGWGSDNFIDAEVVSPEGEVRRLSNGGIPNPYAAARGPASLTLTAPGIVTSATVKLFERFDDETALMLPFATLPEALDTARDLVQRGIGQSLAVLSRRCRTRSCCGPSPSGRRGWRLWRIPPCGAWWPSYPTRCGG